VATRERDQRYLRLAAHIAAWSKDPSSKCGAIAIGDYGQVLAQGYNGFPRGIKDHVERWERRALKYTYIVHAEANLIYNAAHMGVQLAGASIYIAGLPPCHECAKALIQVGVGEIIFDLSTLNKRQTWKDAFKITGALLEEVGIEIRGIKLKS
jgi:dCMP deaminase